MSVERLSRREAIREGHKNFKESAKQFAAASTRDFSHSISGLGMNLSISFGEEAPSNRRHRMNNAKANCGATVAYHCMIRPAVS